MKVLHVIEGMRVADGGPPRVVAGLGRELADAGIEVVIICTNRLKPDREALGLENIPNLTCDALPQGVNLMQYVSGAEPAFDIVQFHGVWNLSASRLTSRLRRSGTPYIIMPHGMLDYWSMAQKKLKKRIYLELFERRALNGAAKLYVLNEDEYGPIAKLGVTSDYFVLPNGVDSEEFDHLPPAGSYRESIGRPAEPLLSYMARIHYKKGADLLVPAFCQLAEDYPDAVLVIAGPDYDLQEQLEAVTREASLQDRILFPGMLIGERRLALLRDTDIFCLPSRQEGHPMSVVEAAYVGAACLVTEACHVPELREADAAEFVELSVESIEQGLRRLIGDKTHRAGIAERAQTYARAHYTWKTIAQRLAEHYEQIVWSSR